MIHFIRHGHRFKPHITGYDRFGFDEYDGCDTCMTEKKFERIKWSDMHFLRNGLFHKIIVFAGVVCSPSMHVYGKCNKKGRHFYE